MYGHYIAMTMSYGGNEQNKLFFISENKTCLKL
jgi:hypothetical protein